MNTEQHLLVFVLDGQRYALPLSAVRRAVRVVAVTPLPKVPPIVLGIINLSGEVIPVINIRNRFNHSPREIHLSDHLVIANTGRRAVALLVDEAKGVIKVSHEEFSPADGIAPGLEMFEGVIKLKDGMILIHDLGRLLSLDEETAIDKALSAENPKDTSEANNNK